MVKGHISIISYNELRLNALYLLLIGIKKFWKKHLKNITKIPISYAKGVVHKNRQIKRHKLTKRDMTLMTLNKHHLKKS